MICTHSYFKGKKHSYKIWKKLNSVKEKLLNNFYNSGQQASESSQIVSSCKFDCQETIFGNNFTDCFVLLQKYTL